MKLFIKSFEEKIFREKLEELKHLDFSLFIDDVSVDMRDYSSLNIMVLVEPNEYFGLHDWTIKNKHRFDIIFTWSDKVLNNCDNAIYLPFGHTWLKPDQYQKQHEKKYEISHLCGNLKKSYGHMMRHEIMERQNEFKIPINFHQTIGDRYNIEDARIGKETVFGQSQYGIVIENFQHRGFFTEKILDCLLLRTIPIYWGAPDIKTFFDDRGIIQFTCVDDLIERIDYFRDYYNLEEIQSAIENNFKYALRYVNFEQNVVNEITKIIKLNGLI